MVPIDCSKRLQTTVNIRCATSQKGDDFKVNHITCTFKFVAMSTPDGRLEEEKDVAIKLVCHLQAFMCTYMLCVL